MKIITVGHQKGGVGKTTLTLNLYDRFTKAGANCAIVDADTQNSIRELIEILGSDKWGQINLLPLPNDWEDLRNLEYDITLIDTPPYLSNQLPQIFAISDFVLIPSKPSPFDLVAARSTCDMVRDAQELNEDMKAAIVLNMVTKNNFNSEIRKGLEQYGFPVLQTQVANRVAYSRSFVKSSSVEVEENQKAINEMQSLANEIINLISE